MQRTLRLSCCPLFLAAGCISTACGSWARRRGRPVHPTGRRAGGEAGPALHRPRRPHVEQLGGVRQLRRPPPEDGHRDGVARRGRIDSRTGASALDPDLQHRQLGRVGAEGWRVRSSPAVPIVSCTMSSSAGNSRSDSVPWTVRGVRQPARGHGTHEHLVDHTRQAADVGPRVHVVPARRLLGAHVPRRPDGHAGPGERLVAGARDGLGDPEVGDQRVAFGQEHVLGFHARAGTPKAIEFIGHRAWRDGERPGGARARKGHTENGAMNLRAE